VAAIGRLALFATIATLAALAAPAADAAPAAAPAAPEAAPGAAETPPAAAQPENPVPHTRSSIRRGRALYLRFCPECHGADGRALIEVIADATDLTAPKRWRYGTTEREIFASIRDGAGVGMPPYRTEIESDVDLWHLVNYIRSLWPEPLRPQVVPEEEELTGPQASPAPATDEPTTATTGAGGRAEESHGDDAPSAVDP
jgi:mono/diheme cytochrome c family protein